MVSLRAAPPSQEKPNYGGTPFEEADLRRKDHPFFWPPCCHKALAPRSPGHSAAASDCRHIGLFGISI